MANMAYVKTDWVMTPRNVTELLNELNQRIFRDTIKIEVQPFKPTDSYWGECLWDIYLERAGTYGFSCWLKTSHLFEIEHRAWSTFLWWVDEAITNEIAVKFKGKWYDEGVEGIFESSPGRYDDFHEYVRRANRVGTIDKLSDKKYREFVYHMTPKEFLPEDLELPEELVL